MNIFCADSHVWIRLWIIVDPCARNARMTMRYPIKKVTWIRSAGWWASSACVEAVSREIPGTWWTVLRRSVHDSCGGYRFPSRCRWWYPWEGERGRRYWRGTSSPRRRHATHPRTLTSRVVAAKYLSRSVRGSVSRIFGSDPWIGRVVFVIRCHQRSTRHWGILRSALCSGPPRLRHCNSGHLLRSFAMLASHIDDRYARQHCWLCSAGIGCKKRCW